MTAENITRLVGLEYELCRLDGDLTTLAAEIAATGCDGATRASYALHQARRLVRKALRRIDGPLTEAAAAAELLAAPPF